MRAIALLRLIINTRAVIHVWLRMRCTSGKA